MASQADFLDFLKDTTQAGLLTASDIIIDSQKAQRSAWGALMKGRPMKKMQKGGQYLQETPILKPANTSGKMVEIGEHTAGQIQNYSELAKAGWRQHENMMVWNQIVVDRNTPAGVSGDDRFIAFHSILEKERLMKKAGTLDFFEDALVGTAVDRDAMEGTDPVAPNKAGKFMSLHAIMNEMPNALPTSAIDVGGKVWSTVSNLDRVNIVNARCIQKGYDNIQPGNLSNLRNALLSALVECRIHPEDFKKTDYAPDDHPYPNPTEFTSKNFAWILASDLGMRVAGEHCKAYNDHTADPEDLAWSVKIGGVPIVYCPTLNTASVYPTGPGGIAGPETSTANNNGGCRYLIASNDSICLFFQEGYAPKESGLLIHPGDAWSATKKALFIWNIIAVRPHGSAIVYPLQNISGVV